jgi:hypothetical protein
MTTHDYELSYKQKLAKSKHDQEVKNNHIIFLKGYIESWNRCIKFESFNVEGAADILMNYYDIHGLELMSADEQLINLSK